MGKNIPEILFRIISRNCSKVVKNWKNLPGHNLHPFPPQLGVLASTLQAHIIVYGQFSRTNPIFHKICYDMVENASSEWSSKFLGLFYINMLPSNISI